eukprot:TRINITY_DN18_c0_g1_i1.p1 TRINITY_DN18_c0_g1~~TRINITY_DN18_c0_g1_i1.p1  ORF type:complete len:306 (+),score=59.84 TRINITY_DN18_c0_g1_i1:72-989(+)
MYSRCKNKRLLSSISSGTRYYSQSTKSSYINSNYTKLLITAGTVGGALLLTYNYQGTTFHASGDVLTPGQYPWNHRFPWQAFDHASIRRGHKVFSQVCSTCHSLNLIAYRNLVDVCYTEEEVKELAEESDFVDGPDEEGNMFERPGKLTDPFPAPYQNEKQARAANNGAKPPDLSLITKARPDGDNYLFSLLTGYKDPPAGIAVRQGSNYNPYFAGGAIAMPPPLMNGMVEYPDGTPASISQMTKDVSTFLAWASEPEHDDRIRITFKMLVVLAAVFIPMNHYKRFVWSVIKTQVVKFPKGKKFY